MALSRGQFTNVISKGNKMAYRNPTGSQKFKKKDTDQLSEKRKLQMGIIGQIIPKLKSLYPVSDKDVEILKKSMKNIEKGQAERKSGKARILKKSKNPHKD